MLLYSIVLLAILLQPTYVLGLPLLSLSNTYW